MAKKAKAAKAKKAARPGAFNRALDREFVRGAKKPAAPVKAEATRSRQPKAERRVLQFEKLGKVITWNVPDAPYADDVNGRAAFVGGFEARVNQVSHGDVKEGVPQRFAAGSGRPGKLQEAFEDGYNEAARQDGQNIQPRTLAGSSSKAAKR